MRVCVCVCVRACVRACVRVCVPTGNAIDFIGLRYEFDNYMFTKDTKEELKMFEYMLQSRESSWGFPSTL